MEHIYKKSETREQEVSNFIEGKLLDAHRVQERGPLKFSDL